MSSGLLLNSVLIFVQFILLWLVSSTLETGVSNYVQIQSYYIFSPHEVPILF